MGRRFQILKKGTEAVIIDLNSNINIPFALNKTGKGQYELVNQTIMRKKNFHTPDMKLKV